MMSKTLQKTRQNMEQKPGVPGTWHRPVVPGTVLWQLGNVLWQLGSVLWQLGTVLWQLGTVLWHLAPILAPILSRNTTEEGHDHD